MLPILFYSDPEQVIPSSSSSPSLPSSYSSWMQSTSFKTDYADAILELVENWDTRRSSSSSSSSLSTSSSEDAALAFLFVSPPWAVFLPKITEMAQILLGDNTKLITIVGGGVVGGGQEIEESSVPVMSFFGGSLPKGSEVQITGITNDDTDECDCIKVDAISARQADSTSSPGPISSSPSSQTTTNVNSVLVFADPLSTKVQGVLQACEDGLRGGENASDGGCYTSNIVAGGISVATNKRQATLAIGNQVLPPGSLVRAVFSGNLGVQVVVSQGCRAIGRTYRVTRVNGPAVVELDSMRAIDELQNTIDHGCNEDEQRLIRSKGVVRGVLGGIYREQDGDEFCHSVKEVNADTDDGPPAMPQPQNFMIRQITGFQPKSGSIMVCGRPQVQEGDYFRFHLRSASAALEDWQRILQRAKTERLFLGSQAGRAVGALQFSCAARGVGLFQQKNVDLQHVQDLIARSGDYRCSSNDDDNKHYPPPPVAGFFASAEIGPVGNSIRMGADPDRRLQQRSYMHGFATVVAMLCDYSGCDSTTDDSYSFTAISPNRLDEENLGVLNSNTTSAWA